MAALCSGDGGGPLPTGCTATNSNLKKDFLAKIKKEFFSFKPVASYLVSVPPKIQ